MHPAEHSASNAKKYKQYVVEVEKALKAFENTTDWPDMINALSKLGKVLLTFAFLHLLTILFNI